MGDNVVRILQGVTEFDGTNQENVIDNIHEILGGNMNGSLRFTFAFWIRHKKQKNSQMEVIFFGRNLFGKTNSFHAPTVFIYNKRERGCTKTERSSFIVWMKGVYASIVFFAQIGGKLSTFMVSKQGDNLSIFIKRDTKAPQLFWKFHLNGGDLETDEWQFVTIVFRATGDLKTTPDHEVNLKRSILFIFTIFKKMV